ENPAGRLPGPPMAGAMRTALAALALTLLAGTAMAAMLAWPRPAGLQALADLHALWGLLGWIGMLLIGVAWQVIPMFQVTPLYPPAITRALGVLVPALLVAVTVAQIAGYTLAAPLRALLFGSFAVFAVVTLSLLARRKRPADSTTLFWRLSMASLLACAPAWYAPPGEAARPLLLGVLFLAGFASSAISGMLYKIVPFLLWHHWQEQGLGRPVPGIRQVIPEARAIAHFRCHLLAVTLLALAALWPAWLLRPAALALIASNLVLALNLVRAARCGRATGAAPAGKPVERPAMPPQAP
ncbi:MAG: permease, partial [Massilia sp.]|nr:permease [Massilia sp.]